MDGGRARRTGSRGRVVSAGLSGVLGVRGSLAVDHRHGRDKHRVNCRGGCWIGRQEGTRVQDVLVIRVLIGMVGGPVMVLSGVRRYMSVTHIRVRVDVLIWGRQESGDQGQGRHEDRATAEDHQTILQAPIAPVKSAHSIQSGGTSVGREIQDEGSIGNAGGSDAGDVCAHDDRSP